MGDPNRCSGPTDPGRGNRRRGFGANRGTANTGCGKIGLEETRLEIEGLLAGPLGSLPDLPPTPTPGPA